VCKWQDVIAPTPPHPNPTQDEKAMKFEKEHKRPASYGRHQKNIKKGCLEWPQSYHLGMGKQPPNKLSYWAWCITGFIVVYQCLSHVFLDLP